MIRYNVSVRNGRLRLYGVSDDGRLWNAYRWPSHLCGIRCGLVPPIKLRVREIREAQGLSQRQLAAQAKVRQGTISAIERGDSSSIDLEVLDRIARALGVDPAILFVRSCP